MADKHLSNIQLNILKDTKSEIEDEINNLEDEITELQNSVIASARKIDKLNIQVKTLRYELNNVDNEITKITARTDDSELLSKNEKLSKKEEKYNDTLTSLEELELRKKDLIDIMNNKKSHVGRRIYQKKIDKASKKIGKLKAKKIKIEGKQRSIILSSQYLNVLRNQKVNNKFAEKNYYSDVATDMKDIRDDILANGKMFIGLRAKYYDSKAKKYRKKSDKSDEKFKKLASGKVSLKSARVMVWTKNRINKQRNIVYKNGTPRFAI